MPAFSGHINIDNFDLKNQRAAISILIISRLKLATITIDSAFAIEVYVIIQLRQRLINWEYNRITNIVASF